MSYAWIIDRDHLAEEELKRSGKAEDNAKGVMGPSDSLPRMSDRLQGHGAGLPTWEVFTFKMYDGDRILYYTGRMITDEGKSEEACFGPLNDFGRPNAGAAAIIYPGHPEMDCG